MLPKAVEAAGPRVVRRWVEFFTANIANDNTQQAYTKATADFFDWLDVHHGIDDNGAVTSLHVSAYRERR
jgi:hypothetical protein